MKAQNDNTKYLILDCNSRPIAHGLLLDSTEPSGWTIQVLGGKSAVVAKHSEVELISLSDYQTSYLVRVIDCRDDRVSMKPLRPLGAEFRETLRVPVSFQSFIYPLSGSWTGRRAIQAVDLSCGGIAFSCPDELAQGECLEVVVPLTRSPLLLTCQVLRSCPSPTGGTIYALKFVDLCSDADKLIQEFVFSEQIRTQAS
jgi:hypothetical protein